MTNEEKKQVLDRYTKKMFKKYVMDDWKFIYFDSPDNICNVARCYPNISEVYITNIAVESFTLSSLKDMFLHELAHAIVGYDQGHNKIFKMVCRQIGCKGSKTHNNYKLDYKNYK